MLPLQAMAQDVNVTRYFTGLWSQTEHESQGINLQVIDQTSGDKVSVVYWFTYGDDEPLLFNKGHYAVPAAHPDDRATADEQYTPELTL